MKPFGSEKETVPAGELSQTIWRAKKKSSSANTQIVPGGFLKVEVNKGQENRHGGMKKFFLVLLGARKPGHSLFVCLLV